MLIYVEILLVINLGLDVLLQPPFGKAPSPKLGIQSGSRFVVPSASCALVFARSCRAVGERAPCWLPPSYFLLSAVFLVLDVLRLPCAAPCVPEACFLLSPLRLLQALFGLRLVL